MGNKNSNIKSTGILLVLIMVAMVALMYINNNNRQGSQGMGKGVKSLAASGQLEAKDQNSMISSVDELMVEAAGTMIKVRNIKGDALWNKSLVGQVRIIKGAGNNIYIVDSSKKLYCMSKGGKLLWDKQLELEANELYIDKNGSVLVDYRSSGAAIIQIFNSKGVDEGKMTFANSALISFAAGKGENTISIVDVSDKIIKGKIITLNLKGEMVWSDNFDNQIMPMIGYIKEDTLLVIGEKTILTYKGESKKQNKLELGKTIYGSNIGDGMAVVLEKGKKGYDAITYDANMKELGRQTIDKAPKGIISYKDNYILYYDEKLQVADSTGAIKAEFKSLPNINKAYFTVDGNILAVSDRMIQKLAYK